MRCNHCGYYDEMDEDFCPICGEVMPKASIKNIQSNINIDNMNGLEFEEFCSKLLEANGFTNVSMTKRKGDHGADILAMKDEISYAIQCKCYKKPVGNKAVQEAYTAKQLYRTDIAVVMTNRRCTPQAKEEARALGIKIWDRGKLYSMMIGYDNHYSFLNTHR